MGCIEEVSFNNHWISKKQLKLEAKKLGNTSYGKYLEDISKKQ